MDLVAYYRQQFGWRDWPTILAALPPLAGQRVFDLGCGPGDLAAELAARGASVVGFDALDEVLDAARARGIGGAEFHACDLRQLPEVGLADGLWCSFGAAYFCDLVPVATAWAQRLRPGGFALFVEVDGMFRHEPVAARTRELLAGYAEAALAAQRYDFAMGHKLATLLPRCGLVLERQFDVADRELAFAGPALPEVVAAWRARLDGMRLLREHCGAEFAAVRDDFLACLQRPDHVAAARVCVCLLRRPGAR